MALAKKTTRTKPMAGHTSKMTSKDTRDLTLAEAVTSDLVVCNNCRGVYVHPLILPCLHTFCQNCVVSMATRSYASGTPAKGIQGEQSRTQGEEEEEESLNQWRQQGRGNNTATEQRQSQSRGGSTAGQQNGQQTPISLQLQCPTCQATVTLAGHDSSTSGDLKNAGTESDTSDSDDETTPEIEQRINGHSVDDDGDPCKGRSPLMSSQTSTGNSNKAKSKKAVTPENDVVRKTPKPSQRGDTNGGNGRANKSIISKNGDISAKELKSIKTIVRNSLPRNHFLDSMANLNRHHNETGRMCAYCKTEGTREEASYLCVQCQDNMCETCAKAHRKTRITREHQVAPFDSIHQGLFDHDIRATTGALPCPDHQRSSASHFCSDCHVVACKLCRSGKHYGHKFLPLVEAVTKFLPEIRKINEAIANSVSASVEYAQFLSKQIGDLTSAKDKAIADINTQTDIIIQMITQHRDEICGLLEEEYVKEKSNIETRIANVRLSGHSSSESASFLRHLTNLGRADEQMNLYTHILRRHRQLAASKPQIMISKLGVKFFPGPNTKTNVAILLGKLDAKRSYLEAQESPKNYLRLSSLMPPTLSPPILMAAVSTDSTTKTMYLSGMDTRDNMLAVVDRENQRVKVLDLHTKKVLKEFGGGNKAKSFKKPFDVVFLPNGILAITDPEAAGVSMYEWTGKFIAHFTGDMRHPRGITLNKAGEVVVVDGHMRRLSVHNATTGEMLRAIHPYREGGGPNHDGNSNQEPILIDPFYIHVTGDGNMVISDAASPNLKILDPNGLLLAETMDYGTGPDQNLHPSGICVDRYGYILVADTNNNRIHLGLPNGQMMEDPLLSPSEGLSHPVSLCLTQEGHVVIGQSGGKLKFYEYIK